MTIEYVDNLIFLIDVMCFRAADGDVLPGPLLWGGHCADFHLRGRIRVLNRVLWHVAVHTQPPLSMFLLVYGNI